MINISDHKVIQVKTTTRYHLTSIRMTIIKKNTNNKHWQGCGERGTLAYCWCSHCVKNSVEVSPKTENRATV